MKRAMQRIGPLFPAVATAGASVCVSSLLLSTGPQTLGPPPVVPPLTSNGGRIVASLSPPARKLPAGRGLVTRSADRRGHSLQARGPAMSTPSVHGQSRPDAKGGAASPTPQSPPSPSPAPPVDPAPPVTAPTAPAPILRASAVNTRPGWGHGDRNHVHTGPPSKASKEPKKQAAPSAAGAQAPDNTQDASAQNNDKKPPETPGKGSNDRKDQGAPAGPAAAADEHGPPPNREKKSAGR
jgi:hypothetical protein